MLNDPDLKQALHEANELQKKNPPAKLSDLKRRAEELAAQQKEQEKQEEQQREAALQKQLEAPDPLTLPGWTPATPQFKPAGSITKKIVEDEVRIIQTGTSTLAPEQLADGWEAAAVAAKNLNHVRNNISSNDRVTTIMFLSRRTAPVQEVKLQARREPGAKVSEVEISAALPKPGNQSDN